MLSTAPLAFCHSSSLDGFPVQELLGRNNLARTRLASRLSRRAEGPAKGVGTPWRRADEPLRARLRRNVFRVFSAGGLGEYCIALSRE